MSEQSAQLRRLLAKAGPPLAAAVVGLVIGWLLASRAAPKDEVVARVNGQPITQRQLWQALERADEDNPRRREMERAIAVRLVHEELARRNLALKRDEYLELMQRADTYFRMIPPTLDSLILDQLIKQEAAKRGITVSPEEINARVEGARDYILASTGLGFDEWLKATGQTEDEYKEQVALQILTGKLVLPDKDRKEFFEQHKEDLRRHPHNSESVIYRQVVVAKKEEAEAIRKQLLTEKGADFAKIAKERSLDPMTRNRGGMVGWAIRGRMNPPDPELEKVLFSLKPGEVSAPLPVTRSGVTDKGKQPAFWRLVKVEKHIPPHELTLEANQDIIEEWMTSDTRFQMRLQEFYDNLRASASVEILSPHYRRLKDKYQYLRRMQEAMSQQTPGTTGLPAPEGGASQGSSRSAGPSRSGEAAPQPGGARR